MWHVNFIKRLGPDPHAGGAKTAGCSGCPDIWELENGDFAVIGADITKGHREVWTELYRRPGLKRVFADQADLSREGMTREEQIFVNFVILHLNSVFYALKSGLAFKIEGLRRDVGWFFSLPIPNPV